MIEELSTVALSIGWAVISIAVATIIYVGFDFGFTLEGGKIKVHKVCFFGLGPVWFKLNKDSEQLFSNIKSCGWNMVNVGDYVVGFSFPKPVGLMIARGSKGK